MHTCSKYLSTHLNPDAKLMNFISLPVYKIKYLVREVRKNDKVRLLHSLLNSDAANSSPNEFIKEKYLKFDR